MEAIVKPTYVPRPIKTEQQYQEALDLIESLLDCPDDSPEVELLELVSILVHDYEQREFPLEDPDPIDAIRYQMEELGISKAELADHVGGKARLSELLNRKRSLSLQQIRTLSSLLSIPADVLLQVA